MKYITGIILIVTLSSCELLFTEPQPSTTPTAIFEEAWTFADREYSFFEFKNIDWDSIYAVYQPLVNDEMTSEELFKVIADMMYELKDGHVNLRSSFDVSRNWTWFLDYPANFNYDLLERNYFKEKQQFVGSFIVYDFGDVGYIRYSSFSNTISESSLNYILKKFEFHRGIIIDVRDNGGGSIMNIERLAERFTDEEILVGRTQYKNGIGENDFSALEDVVLSPYETDNEDEEPLRFTGKVAVLTSRSCYSATNLFAAYMKNLPNVTLIGDQTGGGGGAPAFTELANGWILRVSNTATFMPDGFNIEGGVPVDVAEDMDDTAAQNGFDTILETALFLLRQ